MREKIINLCVFYILSWLLYPPLFVQFEARIVFCVSVFVFVFLAWQNIFRKVQYIALPVVSIFLLSVFSYLRYGFDDYSAYSTVVWYSIFFTISTIFAYYSDVGFYRFRRVFFFFLIGLIFFNVTTIMSLYVNPSVSRLLTAGAEFQLDKVDLSARELLLTGRFPYIFCAVFFVPICMMAFPLRSVSKVEKVLLVGYLASAILMVLMASYSIATITLLMGMLFAFINKRLSILSFVILSFVFFVLFFLFRSSVYEILLYFAGENEDYIAKIEAVFNPMTSGMEMDSRFSVWEVSLMSFLENPLIGGGDTGGHSCILDILGRYGIFVGGICLFSVAYPILVVRKKMMAVGRYGVVNCFLLVLLSALLLNPIQYPYGAVVFVLFPYVCMFYFLEGELVVRSLRLQGKEKRDA